jgi:hypothetical protein
MIRIGCARGSWRITDRKHEARGWRRRKDEARRIAINMARAGAARQGRGRVIRLVPSFGPRMVCTKCGTIGADVRPNWKERSR